MNHFISIFALGLLTLASNRADAASVVIGNQTAGPTVFICQLQLTATPANSIKSIRFQITPKPGSVTRPLAATYPSAYLTKRGYYNSQTGAILLPVFGLYANFNNTVTLTYTFSDNSTQQATVMMPTAAFSDPCGYTNPTVIQARTNSTALSFDYFLIKNACGTFSPTVMDTDGQVRWVGTAGVSGLASALFQNSVYIGTNPTLYRVELDGTFTVLKDYSSAGVTNIHHNIDPGKTGIILDVDTSAWVESINMEVDGLGNILKIWNLGNIITAAMTAGGDTASQFVKPPLPQTGSIITR